MLTSNSRLPELNPLLKNGHLTQDVGRIQSEHQHSHLCPFSPLRLHPLNQPFFFPAAATSPPPPLLLLMLFCGPHECISNWLGRDQTLPRVAQCTSESETWHSWKCSILIYISQNTACPAPFWIQLLANTTAGRDAVTLGLFGWLLEGGNLTTFSFWTWKVEQ